MGSLRRDTSSLNFSPSLEHACAVRRLPRKNGFLAPTIFFISDDRGGSASVVAHRAASRSKSRIIAGPIVTCVREQPLRGIRQTGFEWRITNRGVADANRRHVRGWARRGCSRRPLRQCERPRCRRRADLFFSKSHLATCAQAQRSPVIDVVSVEIRPSTRSRGWGPDDHGLGPRRPTTRRPGTTQVGAIGIEPTTPTVSR